MKKTVLFIPLFAVLATVGLGCSSAEQAQTNETPAANEAVAENTNVQEEDTNVQEEDTNVQEEDTNINDEVVNQEPEVDTNESQGGADENEIDTSDWLTYRNTKYGYSIKHPKQWHISEDLFLEYKTSSDNPKNQVNPEDVLFLTSLSEEEVAAEIKKYKNSNQMEGIIESIGRGKTIFISLSNDTIDNLESEPGFAFTLGDTFNVNDTLQATNVFLEKNWEGESSYHSIYIPFNNDQMTPTGKEVKSIIFNMEMNDNSYDKKTLLQIIKTFNSNS